MDFSVIKDLYIGSTPVQSAWLNGSKVWGRKPAVDEQSIRDAMILWEDVSRHAGTQEYPIPYNDEHDPLFAGMELEQGKYYSQDGVTYLCTRSTGQAVYNNLSELEGVYVEVSNKKDDFTL